MDKSGVPAGLKVQVDSAAPNVGDRRRLAGTASVVMDDGCGLEFAAGDNVSWALDLRRISGGVEVEGALGGTIALECYRCLEGFDFPFRLHLREHVLIIPEGDVEQGDDYADEYLVAGGVLDLEPVFRDAIWLAIPLKHLCGEACRGLCPGCGANLNLEPCSCEAKHVDSRLRPLGELRRRLEEKGEE
jgi:uncharacterized protein